MLARPLTADQDAVALARPSGSSLSRVSTSLPPPSGANLFEPTYQPVGDPTPAGE
jgi:hypothetical protein